MVYFPYISLPEHYTQLLVSSIHHSTLSNTNLELYINENRELNMLIRTIFTDIDADGFLGKILTISGWQGIRNRLAAVYLEYAISGHFPEVANLSLINDLVTLENKLRHFTAPGFSRSFLLGFYVKMALIQMQKFGETQVMSPLVIRDEHLDYMKFSKAKSVRIDWLILQLVQLDHFLGPQRMNTMLKSGIKYDALYSMLLNHEQNTMMENFMRYGASIGDKELFISNTN